jgi:hypothetical protein
VAIFLPLGGQLWFPGLADGLVKDFESGGEFQRLAQARYGTERWLARSPASPLFESGSCRLGRFSITVERLTDATTAKFEGLTFVKDVSGSVLEQLQDGADALGAVQGLADSVGLLVKVLHPLSGPIGYDISHSQPDLPFSAFISVPQPSETSKSIRVAESLLHESMHLQLSLIDSIEPLVFSNHLEAYSPWKREARPILGLLHGLYVFAVIHQFLGTLMGQGNRWRSYSEARQRSIKKQVFSLPKDPEGLSPTGAAIWWQCRTSVLNRSIETVRS